VAAHLRVVLATLVLASLSLVGGKLGAQEPPFTIRKSQKASVTQSLADARIAIIYSRPVARGRTLFGVGGVVPYGKEWSPGADKATTFDVTRDIVIGGQTLPAGKYSLWAVPNAGPWTWIFSRAAEVFHVPYPRGQDQLRIALTPTTGQHLETMAFYFPMVDADSAVMHFHWGETVVPFPIRTAGK